ncbi:MAG: acyl carrier protein [Candidatus Caenarcaniphilales bacterium]|nr:acyl carrier protein [Candidatus Caenarcaniphilales bacterium]
MDREVALAKIQEVISKQLGIEKDKITETSGFMNDLGADSLDIVELVMAFEDEFHVEIPDEDAEKLSTVGDAATYLLDRAKEKEST